MSITAIILVTMLASVGTVVVLGALVYLIGARVRPAGITGSGAASRGEPTTQFTLQRARLTCVGGSSVSANQPCHIHFEWGLHNGAHSFITYRTRLKVQKDATSSFPEAAVPGETTKRAASYDRRIAGAIDGVYTWDRPGVYQVKARLKAAIAGTPFTYQFEVRGRVRVTEALPLPPSSSDSSSLSPVSST